MTVHLNSRKDINLANVYRTAWQGEGVRVSDAALDRITVRSLLADPEMRRPQSRNNGGADLDLRRGPREEAAVAIP